jgi:hypothetical protein
MPSKTNGSASRNGASHAAPGTQVKRADSESSAQPGIDTHVLDGRNEGGQPDFETQDADTSPYSLLLVTADFVDDIERVRIATANRLRSLDQIKGLKESPEYQRWQAQFERISEIEKFAVKELERVMKAHPLGPFIDRTVGLGKKQAARLLAATGDPGARPNVAKLWAYCGLHVIDGKRPRRTKGQQANWSNTAKMRARLCAESCIKQMHSPYRKIYDRERAKWESRETTDLHKHNHALSVVAKEILKDLWIEASGQSRCEAQFQAA